MGAAQLAAVVVVVLGLLGQGCSIEQPVSGPVALTGEWKTIEPPEPLRVENNEQQKVCLQVGQISDVRFDTGVAVGNGQRHQIEGEAFDSEGAQYALKVADVGGDTACLYRPEHPRGPDFPAGRTIVRLRFRSEPPLEVGEIRWYSNDLQ